jgi:hypothetical protein
MTQINGKVDLKLVLLCGNDNKASLFIKFPAYKNSSPFRGPTYTKGPKFSNKNLLLYKGYYS